MATRPGQHRPGRMAMMSCMPDRLTDDQLRAVLVNGLRPTRVTLVDYDPIWAVRYEQIAATLRSALGGRIRLIEHIGSTSVPGLIAKPVIDIVIGIEDPDDESAYLPDLHQLGYTLGVREPGHRALRGHEAGQAVNLHCYHPDSVEVGRYLAFRDRLRTNTADRERYADTKRGLTDREWPDINYYAEAKGPVIHDILDRAGWSD